MEEREDGRQDLGTHLPPSFGDSNLEGLEACRGHRMDGLGHMLRGKQGVMSGFGADLLPRQLTLGDKARSTDHRLVKSLSVRRLRRGKTFERVRHARIGKLTRIQEAEERRSGRVVCCGGSSMISCKT